MKSMHDVILRPLILTEKGEKMRVEQNKLFFEVALKANKAEIKQAIEKLFNVRVTDVSTLIVRGKPGRIGRKLTKRTNWKKAIVTLHEGDTIGFFEGV